MKREEEKYEVIRSILNNALDNAVISKILKEDAVLMFKKYYFENKTFKDIANEMQVSINRVRQYTINTGRRINYSIIMPKRLYFDIEAKIKHAEKIQIENRELKEKLVHLFYKLIWSIKQGKAIDIDK